MNEHEPKMSPWKKAVSALAGWQRDRLILAIAGLYLLSVILALVQIVGARSKSHGSLFSGSRGRVAVVSIQGPIQDRSQERGWGSSKDALDAANRLYRLSKDPMVKAIVLRINSPGGTVAAVQEIHTEILRCQSQGKKVVASLGDVAASGGYYLAAASDKIVANPGTLTGSIGVIMQMGNLEGLFKKVGVQLQVVKSGRYKDIGSPARPLTPEERALLQTTIEDAYDQFLVAVSTGRKKPIDQVRPYADGRIMTGRQAVAAGLVDQLGGYRDALKLARELASLSEDAPVESDSSRGFGELFKRMSGSLFPMSMEETLQEVLPASQLEYRWR